LVAPIRGTRTVARAVARQASAGQVTPMRIVAISRCDRLPLSVAIGAVVSIAPLPGGGGGGGGNAVVGSGN